MLSQDSSSVT